MARVKVKSEVAGKVWKVLARPAQSVAEEEMLLILECMKMEIPVVAPAAGAIKELLVREGEEVFEGQDLAILET